MPLVSVIVPYYQHEKYIHDTIYSLLNQTLKDIEVIVVDDQSTDSGMSVVESFNDARLHMIYRSHNGGPSAALNDGIRAAKSPYIALTGSDDISEPWRLEHQLSYISQKKATIAFSEPTLIDGDGRELHEFMFPVFYNSPTRNSASSVLRDLFVRGNTYCAPTALIRRDLFDDIGDFDETLVQLQDFDLWLRACSKGHEIALGTRRVTRYRLHGANLSHPKNNELVQSELMGCYIKLLRDCPPAAFAKAFPELTTLGEVEANWDQRALIALRHGNTLVQAIGKAMLLDLSSDTLNSRKRRIITDAFVWAAISTNLPSHRALTSKLGEF